jgi:hypothetical protein
MTLSPNLMRRPAKPALGNSRVQKAVRYAFIGTRQQVLSTSEIMLWTHARPVCAARRYLRNGYGQTVRRACERLCERVARGASTGRPILWRLRNTSTE